MPSFPTCTLTEVCCIFSAISCDTVDGSEIRRSPVEVGSLSHCWHLFTGFVCIPTWFSRQISWSSTVSHHFPCMSHRIHAWHTYMKTIKSTIHAGKYAILHGWYGFVDGNFHTTLSPKGLLPKLFEETASGDGWQWWKVAGSVAKSPLANLYVNM